MSIQALVGLPGHGKSYSAVELFIIPALLEKRKIVTNIPVDLDQIRIDFPDYPLDQNYKFIDLSEWKDKPANYWTDPEIMPPSAVYLLDELWKIWPSGLKANKIPEHQLSFIKEHRHNIDETGREPDIVFVTQNLEDICNAVRTMAETTIICVKLTAVGQKNHFRRDYYRGAVKGFIGPKTSFIRSDSLCKYEQSIYKYYKSHTKSQGGHKQINNSGIVKATIFNGLGFKLGGSFVVLFFAVAIYSATKTANDLEKMTQKKSVPTPQPPNNLATQTVTQQAQPTTPKITWSGNYRLIGLVQLSAIKQIAFIQSSDGRRIRIDAVKHCKQELEMTCQFEGETITRYSGSIPTDNNQGSLMPDGSG